jgi:predicted metal-dependent peptidase
MFKLDINKIVRESISINEAEEPKKPQVKIEDCDIVYAQDGTAIDVKKLKLEMESAKVAIVTQSPLFAPYIHEFVPIYTWLVETMATDGIRLFVNPAFAFKLTWHQKIFVIIHEIMHCVLLHMIRGKGLNHQLSNIAGDYEINAVIIDTIDDFSEAFIKELGGLYDKKYLNQPMEAIYKDLLKNPPPQKKGQGGNGQPGKGQPGQSQPGQGSPSDSTEGSGKGMQGGKEVEVASGGEGIKSTDPAETGTVIPKELGEKIAEESGYDKSEIGKDINNEAKWGKNGKKMLEDAEKKAGSGKGGALITILGGLHRGAVDWKSIFSRFVAHALSPETEQRLGNKKHLGGEILRYGERTLYNAIEKIVVAVDVSGSVDSEMLQNMINEINGIIFSKRIKEIVVIFFDDGVDENSVQYIKVGNAPFVPKKISGGGGTNFQKPLDWIKEKLKDKVNLCVFLTDGFADAPRKPIYANKFIWLIYNNFSFNEPFGKCIKIKL